jgi:hypothetical protein
VLLRIVPVTILLIGGALSARADFSFLVTQQVTGGLYGREARRLDQVSRFYWKGERMAIERDGTTTIIDFDAKTVTVIDPTSRTYSVRVLLPPSPMAVDAPDLTKAPLARVVEPGNEKILNGLVTRKVISTIFANVELPGGFAIRVEAEAEQWVSLDIKGSEEMHAFFRKHEADFPWEILSPHASTTMREGLARIQALMAQSVGALVHSVSRVRLPADAQLIIPPHADPAVVNENQRGLRILQERARHGDVRGVLWETTSDASEFSDADIPNYVFEIPADYQRQADAGAR